MRSGASRRRWHRSCHHTTGWTAATRGRPMTLSMGKCHLPEGSSLGADTLSCGRLHCLLQLPANPKCPHPLRVGGCIAAAAVPPPSVGVRIANAATCKLEGREGSEMRVITRNARIDGLRQARLPDQLLGAGCSCPVGQVTHCSSQCCACIASAHYWGGAMLRL